MIKQYLLINDMWNMLILFTMTQFVSSTTGMDCVHHKYCIVGAGPGGLQIGYFLHRAGRDYIVFEATNKSGSFFERYPRHRKLISINKRNTGRVNVEFNLRHDWNSLLSHDDDLKVTKYSNEMFPNADVLLKYLDDFKSKLNINVQFNTTINNIHKKLNPISTNETIFMMNDQHQNCYTCRILILATGLSTPNIPKLEGIELAVGYENVSIDPNDYEGKSVLIFGKGNSAFEMASGIYGYTNLIHLVSRSPLRLAWSTHYVGDLRAVNNELLDTYQLKSLDGISESIFNFMTLSKTGNKFQLKLIDYIKYYHDRFPYNEPYDVVIRATGFKFDSGLFKNKNITRGKRRARKYPAIHANYESVDTSDLYYAGTVSHSLDFRKSAGGFIHGFRYTAQALHRFLEWRYESIPWPSVIIPRSQIIKIILKRINQSSGLYQMFQNLGDIAILSEDGKTARYIEEYPIKLLHELTQRTGVNASSVLVLLLEFGKNFSGPAKDVFYKNRAGATTRMAHESKFLHPVIYYFKKLPTEQEMTRTELWPDLPRPDKIHYIVEDFTAVWNSHTAHILPLRRFLEHVFQSDQCTFFAQQCFNIVMTHAIIPEYCTEQYLSGRGLSLTESLERRLFQL